MFRIAEGCRKRRADIFCPYGFARCVCTAIAAEVDVSVIHPKSGLSAAARRDPLVERSMLTKY